VETFRGRCYEEWVFAAAERRLGNGARCAFEYKLYRVPRNIFMEAIMAKYYCKYCGSSSVSIAGLTGGSCSKSPSKRHQPYEGNEKSKYYCEYCGLSSGSIAGLTSGPCSKSPSKHHQPYEGNEQSKYICKYCGLSAGSIAGLTGGSCSKSPNKHHQPVK
jgi:hypothetical protein